MANSSFVAVSTRHTQSVTDFRQRSTETLERLNRTGEAEVLTVNGQARAVLLSPEAFDAMSRELALSRDDAAMRRAIAELEAGKGVPAEQGMNAIRDDLLVRARGESAATNHQAR